MRVDMLRNVLLSLLFILIVVGGLAGAYASQIRMLIAAGESMVPPPDAVSTVEAVQQKWKRSVSAVGTVVAVQGVMVSSEIPGKVVHFSFESGQCVEEGQILVELDASSEQAQLKAAESSFRLAQINLDRSRELLARDAVAQSDFDAAEAQAQQAEAQVENLRAILAKKTLRAPFAGRLGIRQVNLGQFVGSGAPMVSIQSIDPVYVDFYVPQQRLASVKEGYEVEVTSDLQTEILRGSVSAVAAEIDEATRNVRVRASLPSPDGVLRPGMFVRARVYEPFEAEVTAIPVTSVVYAPYGNSVFVVEENEAGATIARQRFIRLGEVRGDYVQVLQGVATGEQVVSNGAFKLRNNVKVKVDNSSSPEIQLDPKPSEA